ncbi:MAG: hypothetical protein ABI995_10790 [Acidobacteriota bacterium]
MGLGLRAAAKQLGISHVALKKAADTGRVTRGADGSFDVDQCRAEIAAKSHPGKQRAARSQQKQPSTLPETSADPPAKPAGPDESLSYNQLVEARERLKLERDRLDLAKRKGELVEKDAVNAYIAGMILKARDIMLQIGPELRDKLSKVSDPVKCEELVMVEIRRGLQEIAKYS